ncbi:protease modulator HflC [Gammaproteobacteria bacterium]|jgi:membrane protease subunit HflC|nr:protease modulator HflC [Gammaproteobacteria bacterium]MDA9181188.1 protease modulator HflC [Gammaproteobacteria bacterium]MDC0482667.1 protease modulator HflC [Gammaproteobacteria bacterium]|tara:strand:- start:1140 stop:1994 length:855 start_codon:yes stop_codon:yes gene_type:complete
MNTKLLFIIGGIFVIFSSTTFFVNETQRAMVFQLGEIKRADLKPGLHFKLPLVNNVRKFDARILTIDAQPELFLTSEKKNMSVDFFVKWRIANVKTYYKSTLGDRARAEGRIVQIVKDELKNQFGIRTIQEAISGEREEIMAELEAKAQLVATELGIELVDVRVSRIELPEDVSESVYQRMRAERSRTAKDFRARGKETAENIKAQADKKRTVIIAEAYRTSQQEKGSGDAKSTAIYANAYNQDAEFYAFTRSLQAYANSFKSKSDMLVIDPDSDFFKYFKNIK